MRYRIYKEGSSYALYVIDSDGRESFIQYHLTEGAARRYIRRQFKKRERKLVYDTAVQG